MVTFDFSVIGTDLPYVALEVSSIAAEEVKAMAELIYFGVMVNSPVDSGKFRANWNVSLNIPDYSTSDATMPDLGKVARLNPKDGDTIFIGNGLPYYPVLEYGLYPGTGPKTINGFSRQAPDGVLRPTLNELLGAL